MIVAGIDPGLTGALALIDGETCDVVECIDMPVQQGARGRREIDCVRLLATFAGWRAAGCRLVVLEAQQARPGLSSVSVASTFRGEGMLACGLVASQLPFELAHAATWKRTMGLTAEKADSRALARQLFPMAPPLLGRRKDEGRAEALLLAAFAARRWRAAA